jgi:putative transposase
MWFREHRELLSYSLNKLYKSIGISKQSVLKYEERRRREDETLEQMIAIVNQVRIDYPGMGIRTIYEKMRPSGIGRDKFEKQSLECGLGLARRKNWRCTTDSRGVKRFDNKLKDFKPTKPDQAWVSDITYYELNNRFYFLTFIEDLYTRYVKGHSVSSTLRTEDVIIPALKQAIRRRKI